MSKRQVEDDRSMAEGLARVEAIPEGNVVRNHGLAQQVQEQQLAKAQPRLEPESKESDAKSSDPESKESDEPVKGLEDANPAGENDGDTFEHRDFFPAASYHDEVRRRFPDPIAANVSEAWNSVVKIRGVCGNYRWFGTGWLVQRPGWQVTVEEVGLNFIVSKKVKSMVITNRHVYNDGHIDRQHIQLHAQFEDDGRWWPLTRPIFESKQTPNNDRIANLERDQLDFVGLDFDDTQLEGEAFQWLCQRSKNFLQWEESARIYDIAKGMPVIVIGHARGGRKTVSFGQLEEDYNQTACFRYTDNATRPGNSGSPIFVIRLQSQLCASRVCALHYRGSYGVAFCGGIAEHLRAGVAHTKLTADAMSAADFLRNITRNPRLEFV